MPENKKKKRSISRSLVLDATILFENVYKERVMFGGDKRFTSTLLIEKDSPSAKLLKTTYDKVVKQAKDEFGVDINKWANLVKDGDNDPYFGKPDFTSNRNMVIIEPKSTKKPTIYKKVSDTEIKETEQENFIGRFDKVKAAVSIHFGFLRKEGGQTTNVPFLTLYLNGLVLVEKGKFMSSGDLDSAAGESLASAMGLKLVNKKTTVEKLEKQEKESDPMPKAEEPKKEETKNDEDDLFG